MKKAPSTILATADLTVGMLGFALPASAAINPGTTPNPAHTGLKTPPPPPPPPPPPILGGGGGAGQGGKPGQGGIGGGNTGPKHHPRPVYHLKPTPTCHPRPKPPVRPIGYNEGSNKYKGYTTTFYSWEHSKSGHNIKCDPKPAPVKHPEKHPAPPKHHHAPNNHWWQGWF